MANICFVNPPWWAGKQNGQRMAGVRAGSRWPFTMPTLSEPDRPVFGEYLPFPFFLASAAGYARKAGADVAFRDSIALRESWSSFLSWLDAEKPEYLVVESATPSWEHDRTMLRDYVRATFPHLKVVLAGPIAAKGAEILGEDWIHAVIRGEYEKGVVKVLGGASGLIDFDLLTEAEMDSFYPWIDSLHARRYCDSNPQGQQWPHLQTLTSRGCPYKCIFCVWPAVLTGNDPDGTGRRTVRQHSPEHLEKFIRDVQRVFGYRSVYFDDDTMNLGDKHTLAVCGVMRKIGLPWSCMCRADTVKPDTWKEMKGSGCFGVKIGVESGSAEVLDRIVNKRLDLNNVLETLRLLRGLGMTVHTTFTIGLPGETPAQQRETLVFIQRLYAEGLTTTHQLSGTASIEGTPLATLEEAGSLEKYPGASCGGGYVSGADGAEKLRRMALL